MLEYPWGSPLCSRIDTHFWGWPGEKEERQKKSSSLGIFIPISSILMKYKEIFLTAEYVWFFWSDPPNNTHSHFDMSISGTFNTEVTSDQRELYHICLKKTSLGESGGHGGRKFLKIWLEIPKNTIGATCLATVQKIWIHSQLNGSGLTTAPTSATLPPSWEKTEHLAMCWGILLEWSFLMRKGNAYRPCYSHCVSNEMSRVWRQWCQQTGMLADRVVDDSCGVSQMSISMRKHEGWLQYRAAVICRKPKGDFERKGVIRTEREISRKMKQIK